MEEKEDQTPLQEIVYKPTTLEKTSTALIPESTPKSGSFLYFATCIANLIAFTAGLAFGWTSPVLPKLVGTNDTSINPLGYRITNVEESWIAALICLGGMFGPLIAGWMADKIGRKQTLLLVSIPMVTSFFIIAYARTLMLYYISRLMIGFGAGSTLTVLPMYLGEIAEDHNRGTLGCSLAVFISIGLLFAFAVGPFLTIRNFCLLSSVPLLIFIPVFALFIPETPQYLASANRNKDLERSLTKLRNKTPSEIQREMNDIMKNVMEESRNKGSIGDLFKHKGLRKGLIITLGNILLQQFAGINAVLAYMQTIFNATGSKLAPEISAIIIGVIQMLATVATSLLVEKLGRRILFLVSTIGSSLSLIALGFYFYQKSNGSNVENISWLPVASLIVFVVAFNAGLGPLPWAVMAELFPPNVKSVAATLTSFTCLGGAFIITIFFPPLVLLIGMAKCFWVFALVCLAGAIFIYWILPETKGRSLQEIQKLLEGGEK